MRKYIYIVFLLMGVCVMNYSLALANGDYADEETKRRVELRMVGEVYQRASGKEPTLPNVIKSLEIANATGRKSVEVSFALDILLLKNIKTKDIKIAEFAEKLVKCHNNNLKNWNIRYKSSIVLLDIQKAKGVELLRLILEDPKSPLSFKILAGHRLVEVGNLEGYSILEEGLLSADKGNRRNAISLFRQYLSHDGRVFNVKGDKIDIGSLMQSLRKKVDPETFKELERIYQIKDKIDG